MKKLMLSLVLAGSLVGYVAANEQEIVSSVEEVTTTESVEQVTEEAK